ncbi:regulatory protein, FmdB family [Salinisphaera sp. PC39]|uniref:FmdB family zinc ribbon protein n=1 Tax=Salinisphaera sp. PC39 TaxID=1304156 RepID=UPI003342AA0B
MPIYEYVCRECGEEIEKLQKLSDAPLTECPACHKDALKRKISSAGFRLAGGGWYETDFKSEGKRNLAGDQGGTEKKGAGETKSDSGKSDGGKSNGGKSGGSKSESSTGSGATA